MTTVINIIPSDYEGDPRATLGYNWQDYSNRIPGHDVIVDRTEDGIDYRSAAENAMRELGIDSARITCMWCGGWSGDMSLTDTENDEHNISAGETPEETAAIVKLNDRIDMHEQDDTHKHHPGYCTKCHSYCYGDCES